MILVVNCIGFVYVQHAKPCVNGIGIIEAWGQDVLTGNGSRENMPTFLMAVFLSGCVNQINLMEVLAHTEEIKFLEWIPDLQSGEELARTLTDLCEILILAVAEGAGVSFLHPVSIERAMGFWNDDVLPAVRAGEARGFLAKESGKVVGCVMLQVKNPENQAHRGDVWKMLVHPDFRRRGIARSLLTALEIAAREEGKTLLTLDTQPNSNAFPLYVSMGYQVAGTIPNFARHSVQDHMESTTILYKNLDSEN